MSKRAGERKREREKERERERNKSWLKIYDWFVIHYIDREMPSFYYVLLIFNC